MMFLLNMKSEGSLHIIKLVPVTADLVTSVLKLLHGKSKAITRLRPPRNDWFYPSRGNSIATAVFTQQDTVECVRAASSRVPLQLGIVFSRVRRVHVQNRTGRSRVQVEVQRRAIPIYASRVRHVRARTVL